MEQAIERTLDALEEGKIDRRTAVGKLAALATAVVGGFGVSRAATYRAKGLNHLALRVTDVARSRDFYREHLGLEVLQQDGDERCFMSVGEEDFVALFRGESAGIDHYCYTIDDYEAGAAVERLKQAGLAPVRRQNRVYFDDPDGLTVQLSGRYDSRPR